MNKTLEHVMGTLWRQIHTVMGSSPETIYERVSREVVIRAGGTALDLGCGGGTSILATVSTGAAPGLMTGLDRSAGRLALARERCAALPCPVLLVRGTMAALPVGNATMDSVCAVSALHEVGPTTRRQTLDEIARVLRPGGHFTLVDWSRPRLGPQGMLLLPWLWLLRRQSDHYRNRYRDLCLARGLHRVRDTYLTDLIRAQVFRKAGDAPTA